MPTYDCSVEASVIEAKPNFRAFCIVGYQETARYASLPLDSSTSGLCQMNVRLRLFMKSLPAEFSLPEPLGST